VTHRGMVQVQRAIIVAFVLLAAVFWFYALYLDSFYYQNAPREAVPVEGRVHLKIIHHGARVFLTEREVFNFDVLFPSISIGSVLIAGLLALRWKQFSFTNASKGADLFSFFRKNKRT
jgi:hypothetical protein